jgi:hypothetical protein
MTISIGCDLVGGDAVLLGMNCGDETELMLGGMLQMA